MTECKLFVDKSDRGFWTQMERLNQHTMTPENECKTFYVKKDGNK